ncbi:uncharacterized protein LOC119721017 isoform X2 [Patiria miniata]|uniref:Superoxide dismutase copper/zinc binding domain-containing protein n=1 Tax=Patiria miniata TaxID=46514 RepID=A0A913Z7K2_PATMI|nr:uncharacterized protein LOC119721017 isoform X2 [Patiria miniata]
MKHFVGLGLLIYHLCFLHGAAGETNQTNLHVASFSMRGASGQVSFFEDGPGQDVTIHVALIGLEPGTYTWAVHEKPMIYGQQPVCGDALIGGVYTHGGDLSAVENTTRVSESGSWNASYSNAVISLKGPQSITGRTLVLQESSSQEKYCAMIANSREMITAVARFDAPFAGTVTFRQERDNPEAETAILVELYDVTDPLTSMTYAWRVSSNSGYNHDMDLATRCTETSSDVYNPIGIDAMACGIDDPSRCPIGHLTGKFADVTVEPLPSVVTRYFIDTNLPLSGENSVMGKSLVFSDAAGDSVACSPVLELKPKSVEALFSVRNVSGTIRFSQRSPYDASKITVALENLRGLGTGIHLQELPPPPRTYASDWPAGPDNVAGHHNPYGIGPAPPPGTGTHDQYEVGDLSGKFGLMTGFNHFNDTYLDWNLPLFGRNSIIGRSLVIHNIDGERWLYAAIGYPTKRKIVKAVFKAPSVGKIVMSQAIDDPYADTSIFVEMAYADGSDTTTGHDWHIHTQSVADDYISTNGRCSSCAGHFNPFGADLGPNYTECSPEFPQRCELGDLSKKHGQLTVTNQMNLGAGKFFFMETGLPLSGVHSIAGRSIVIHAADGGSPRISCANLLEVPPTETTADLWSEGPVSGDISFQQESVFDPVQVHVNVEGLSSLAGGWHVHLLPIDEDVDSAPCGPASVQGHYNPFGVVGSPAYGTQDMYEMGDLSGKFGGFSDSPDAWNHVYYDTNLALEGPRSIIGRSLVVHKSADGSRWVCATLHRKTHQDDFIMKAKAVITTSDYTGYAVLSQTRYHTGALGDATVDFGLQSNVAEEDTFYWNLHPGQVDDDTCLDSSSIFNPYEVSMVAEYGSQCDTKSQLRCAVGDLTGKHGNMSSAVKRAVYTDVNLPLTGQDSVLGLSLHLISTNTGQFACGTVEPDPSTGRAEYLSYPSTTIFDPYKFRQAMHDHMTNAEMWQIVATQEPQNNPMNDCAVLKFYFIGTGLDDMDREFKQKANSDELGEYSPTSQCKDVSGGSSRTTTVGSFVFSVLLAPFLVLRLLN